MKKKDFLKTFISLILFLTINLSFATTYYVDAENGNDNNDGTSPSSAWKTIDRVNNFKGLSAGDSVLFKSGNVFRGNLRTKSGSSAGFITYSKYGKGAKPLLLGSVNKTKQGDWINEGNNIWRCSVSFGLDIGNIIFNFESSVGFKKWYKSELTNQGDFWYDRSGTQQLKIFSTSNPATFYTNIEIALTLDIIKFNNSSYVQINNLDLRYGGAHAMKGNNSSYITIQDCDISYIGGGLLKNYKNNIRYGNGIEFWENAHDNVVERCTLNQIYDAALTSQGVEDGYIAYNLFFRNNIIRNSEYSFEFWAAKYNTSVRDIYFENNTCLNAGFGWGHAQRPKLNGAHVMLSNIDAKTSNIVIRNNIFKNSTEYSIRFYRKEDVSKYTVDYNCYWEDSGDVARIWGNSYDYTTQWETYKKVSGQDAHSIIKNPSLKSDYSLKDTSACVDKGMNTPTVTHDFNEKPRPQN